MPTNQMVKYVGPKKNMHVPFPADNKLPLWSMSDLDEMVTFPRNQMVELTRERAEALLKQSPGVFKDCGPIRAAQKPKTKESVNVEGSENPALEDPEHTDDYTSDGAGV